MITDPDGWRTYPPSAKFEGDDDVGISGTKTFEMAAIPQTKKTASPALEWSYFDPIKEQYVTLTEKGWPIKIEGDIQATATPVRRWRSRRRQPNQATPDILYIRADSTGWGETFEPLYANRVFWEAQGAPLLALLAFVGLAGGAEARGGRAGAAARAIAQGEGGGAGGDAAARRAGERAVPGGGAGAAAGGGDPDGPDAGHAGWDGGGEGAGAGRGDGGTGAAGIRPAGGGRFMREPRAAGARPRRRSG